MKFNKKLFTSLLLTTTIIPVTIVASASLTSCSQAKQKNYAAFTSQTGIGADGNKLTKIFTWFTYDVKTKTHNIIPTKSYVLTQKLIFELQKYTTDWNLYFYHSELAMNPIHQNWQWMDFTTYYNTVCKTVPTLVENRINKPWN